MAAFQCFVIFAEMRTGSNFLEANLNAMAGVTCHGEAFNPYFIGYPDTDSLLGVTEEKREENPAILLDAIKGSSGLNGFRYFHDHDKRVFATIMDDPRCAKIILTRNPVDSYVSWKIAQATGQWKLTDAKRRKSAKARFDAVEFAETLAATSSFQQLVDRKLQVSGQTAFRLRYEDLGSVEVMNGLAAFLGADAQLEKLDRSLKIQNPESVSEKVSNYDEMQQALSGFDTFGLTTSPNLEPDRSAAVQSYIAGASTPLLYLPLKSGPETEIRQWLAAIDGVSGDQLISKMTQKMLRQWKRAHPEHRSFTVVRHPLARAHHAYCAHILGMGTPDFGAIRQTLIRRYDLPVTVDGVDESYTLDMHKAGFEIFLHFLKQNLQGQTSIRIDAAWCSQSQAMQGFGRFALPDFVFREDEISTQLPRLASQLGAAKKAKVPAGKALGPFSLGEIYDDTLEELAASAYARDYLMFGFKSWR